MDARTQIIDAHHHLWDLENHRYPWLQEPMDHFAGDYADIRRSYLVRSFREDAGRHWEVVKSVHVQAEYDHANPVGETTWLQEVHNDAASNGLPTGVVAYADLADPAVEEVLAAHCRFPVTRGIRHMLNYAGRPGMDFASRGDLMDDRRWRGGYRLLAKYNLSFDLQVWPWQLKDAARLVQDIPEVPVILNHTGMPINHDPSGMQEWREGMRALAEAPHVSAKISALGMVVKPFSVGNIQPIVLETIDIFGVDRCMFASNYPVDRLFASYHEIWSAYDRITSGFSHADRRKLFHDNAERYYRI